MSFFNDAQRDGLLTGRYICSECGGLMEFEDEWEDTLVCPACGHSVDLEHYYADSVKHDGKTYLFPVYVMNGEGTNTGGEKETFDIIIDALK